MTLHKQAFACLLLLAFLACTNDKPTPTSDASPVQLIVDSAAAYHGVQHYDGSTVDFIFRDRHYSIRRNGGAYEYSFVFMDSLGPIKGVLSNDGYHEYRSGKAQQPSRKDSLIRAEALNSVCYFVMLPLSLNDPSVIKTLEGEEVIDNKRYYRVRVYFQEIGGGQDFQDVYLYWFDAEDYSLDYMAYSFLVNEGGTRFRKAINQRRVNGIIFQDYENYKGPIADSLASISGLYKAEALLLLSTVEIRGIKVLKP